MKQQFFVASDDTSMFTLEPPRFGFAGSWGGCLTRLKF
jgi:hypothetical protein